MAQTFIERLTEEQVRAFLDGVYPKEEHSYQFDKHKDVIYVYVEEYIHCLAKLHFSMWEYETIDCECHSQWIKYLYKVFGEEYKEAYLKNCAKIFI